MNYSDTNQLEYVLTHELIHIKRFDMLAKWFLVVALCVHWFNPLVWVMYIFANRDIELSCDESVVRTFGEEKKTTYALALINMAESRRQSIPLYSNFSKNAIEERIVAIMKTNQSNLLGGLLVCVFLIGSIFTTNIGFAKEDLETLELFDHIDAPEDIYHYADSVNEVYSETAIPISEDQRIYIRNTIFTDQHVYATIGLEGDMQGQPIIDGRIVINDEDTIYALAGEFKEIEQEDGVRYFFYVGDITEARTINGKKEVALNNVLKISNLKDQENALLELEIHLNGNDYDIRTPIEDISEELLIFHPKVLNDDSDFFETIILTPLGFHMTKSSKDIDQDGAEPHFKMTILLTDGTEIKLTHDSRGTISDEGFPMDMQRGHNAQMDEYIFEWRFSRWELDLTRVKDLIIDDVTY